MKKISALGFVVLFFMSCGSAQKGADQEGAITSIRWETEGGGNIRFEITPAGNAYQIRVTRHAFQEVETILSLPPEEEEVYALITAIFEKRKDLHDETFAPSGATGTWTSITVRYAGGSPVTIDTIDASGGLSPIYAYVAKNIQQTP